MPLLSTPSSWNSSFLLFSIAHHALPGTFGRYMNHVIGQRLELPLSPLSLLRHSKQEMTGGRYFNERWLENDNYKQWLRQGPNQRVVCEVCKKDL